MVKESAERCSHSGHGGHNNRTYNDNNSNKGCLMLFGINILEKNQVNNIISGDSIKKSCSMGNLSSCDVDAENPEAGYLSDGLILTHKRRRPSQYRDRRKGIPWTEEEHKQFLAGLKHLGKGDWKGISRKFVRSRTSTQVASHAQKYFIRLGDNEKRTRRPSLFDMPLVFAEQKKTALDSPVSSGKKFIENTLKPSSSGIFLTMKKNADNNSQSINQTEMVNQFPQLSLYSPQTAPVVTAAGLPIYNGIPNVVRTPSNLCFANCNFPRPSHLHSPRIQGNIDNGFPVSPHPSGIPPPRTPASHSSSQASHESPSTKKDSLHLKIRQPQSTQKTQLSFQDVGAIRVN